MRKLELLAITVALGLATSGCATKEYVHEYVQGQLKPVQDRLNTLEQRAETSDSGHRRMDAQVRALGGRLDQAEARLKSHDERIKSHDERLNALSKTAREALDRAVAAGKLAEGKLLYEVVMTQDTLRFATEKANLSEEAKAALDEFAARIKAEGKPVFIEIQGHTDIRGSAAYNERLGLMRAEAVRSHLHRKGGLPLARMSAISYGHTEPVADNRTREGRMQNRRVVLVVLQ